ncbi:hypothetical protein HGRIS_008246 [Hohenbuehelia grisea]|uniref:Uncharacterized protein n=1 Tax=Hohenbuehelia grisea TaxID=104357 RepID=A0ABR3J7F4_9AGAR
MLSSWFPPKRAEDGPQRTNSDDAVAAHENGAAEPLVDEDDKYPKRAATTAIVTPHDAVLAELQEHNPTINLSARIEEQLIPALQAESEQPRVPQSETLCDPWNGAPLASMSKALPVDFPDGSSGKGLCRNEDFWGQLSKILDLQDGIATLHIDMEEIGTKASDRRTSGPGARRPTKPFPSWDLDAGTLSASSKTSFGLGSHSREGSSPGVAGDDAEDVGANVEEDEEAVRNKAREAEFANLATKFEGRRTKIDEIMSKLDDLSEALTELHALHTPEIIFASSNDPSRQNSVAAQASPSALPIVPAASSLPTKAKIDTSLPLSAGKASTKPPVLSLKPMEPKHPEAVWSRRPISHLDRSASVGQSRHHPPISDSPKSIGSLLPPTGD